MCVHHLSLIKEEKKKYKKFLVTFIKNEKRIDECEYVCVILFTTLNNWWCLISIHVRYSYTVHSSTMLIFYRTVVFVLTYIYLLCFVNNSENKIDAHGNRI